MFLSSIPPEYKRSNLTGEKNQAKQHYLQDDIELLLQNLIFIPGLATSCKAPEKSEKAFKMTKKEWYPGFQHHHEYQKAPLKWRKGDEQQKMLPSKKFFS